MVEQGVDYAVLEVGLGGRLDATNVIPKSLVSVITNIGFDHRELLGETLGEIAIEKAGILKSGGVCVTGIDGAEAFDAVCQVATERDVPLHRVVEGRDWVSESDRTVTIRTPRFTVSHAPLQLRGRFQHANAALAVHALDYAGIDLAPKAIADGLAAAYAPGRLETVRTANPAIVLDVAHNELAGGVLRDALIDDFGAAVRPIILVVGMSRGHDPVELIGTLLDVSHVGAALRPVLLIATAPGFRPRPAEDVAAAARFHGCANVEMCGSVTGAVSRAIAYCRDLKDPLIVVTGSFYTVGELPPEAWVDLLRDWPIDASPSEV